MKSKIILYILLSFTLSLSRGYSQTIISVSPGGALETLEEARDYIRNNFASMTENIVVNFEPGYYYIDTPVLLTAADSGRGGYSIT
jgi:hypothetical protein